MRDGGGNYGLISSPLVFFRAIAGFVERPAPSMIELVGLRGRPERCLTLEELREN